MYFRVCCCATTRCKDKICKLDSALLFAIFAGFNYADFDIRWIQLVVDQFGHVPPKFECDAGAVAAVSHQPLWQNDTCPM